MEVTVEHLGGVQFEIKARHHTIVSDQPLENFGHDEGMTPPELLLASHCDVPRSGRFRNDALWGTKFNWGIT